MPSMLCKRCSLAAQLNVNINVGNIKHHSSYQDMVESAKVGCEMCAAVISGISEQSRGIVEQEQSGAHDTDDMQIFCKAVQREDVEESYDSYLHIVFEGKLLGAVHQFLPRPSAIDDEIFNPKLGLAIPRSSRSPACFEMILRWMTRCKESHKRCNPDPASLMPTRVLDIGNLSAPPRIFVTSGKNGEYATLSYCWGKGYQPVTTAYNLKHRLDVLHLTNLPPVFQDAITIMRKFGFRYLWIDSLCILQDSVDDWNAESSKMHQYYMGSSLNIIASAAKDPTYGIFDSANLSREEGKYDTFPFGCLNTRGQNFVAKRAWTLQEEILSPRSILYTAGRIYWLCNQESSNEVFPATRLSRGFCMHTHTQNKMLFHLPGLWDEKRQESLPQGDDEYEEFFDWWYGILNNYLTKEMSFDRDRSPGIAGLAKEFARRTNTQYVCGLWREDFIRGLCWRGNGAQNNSLEYIGPTWSWASLHPPIHGDALVYNIHQRGDFLVDDDTAKIVNVHVVNEAQDPYGQIKEAVLILAAPARKFNTITEPILYNYTGILCGCRDIRCDFDDQSRYHASSPIIVHPETIFLQLGRWGYHRNPGKGEDLFALVLEPTGRENVHFGEYIEYRRVGMAEFPDSNYSNLTRGWTKQMVAII